MDEEFNEWVARSIPPTRPMTQWDMVYLRAAWQSSARRADRKAREECADIAKVHASCEGIAQLIEYEIRLTISEEQ